MGENVAPFPPQGVITEDNLMVNIDSVIYFQIIDPVRAAYEAQDYIRAIEQLTMTTLRNIIGGLDLEQALTSREQINQQLRIVLDEATGKWGIKVNRVELRAIEPPATIRDAMEKGARAERDRRATVLLADGHRQAQMLRAEGEAQAITTVFNAIHAGQPDQALLAYQYMQMLPTIARGDANKVWIVPSELNKALEGLGSAVGSVASAIPAQARGDFTAPEKIDIQREIAQQDADEAEADRTVEEAIAAAQELESPSLRGDKPPVAEQLALSTSPQRADGAPPRAGMEYPTAYEPQGQPSSQ